FAREFLVDSPEKQPESWVVFWLHPRNGYHHLGGAEENSILDSIRGPQPTELAVFAYVRGYLRHAVSRRELVPSRILIDRRLWQNQVKAPLRELSVGLSIGSGIATERLKAQSGLPHHLCISGHVHLVFEGDILIQFAWIAK